MTSPTPTILWGSLGPDSHTIDTALEQATGKQQSLVHLALPWAIGRTTNGTPNYQAFPASMLQPAYARGSVVLLDWVNWDLNNRADPVFSLDAVLAGQHDAFIHAWAKDAATWHRPILLRFDSEMNGSWWLYGAQPAKFVAAWKKVRGIFLAEGATNVAWLWCPNASAPAGTQWPTATDKLASYYPGDDQVDWTGFDTYNWSSANGGPWMTFDQIANGYPGWLGTTYDAIAALAPSKPMCLAEWGCWDDQRKPLWLVDALAAIPARFPLVRAISYFNWDTGNGAAKWPLSGDALAAFKAGIASPVYLPAGVWTPEDGKPLGAPPLSLSVAPDVPLAFRLRGLATWDQVAASAGTQADSLKMALTAATTRAVTAEASAAAANASLSDVQTSLQTLIRVGGQGT